VRVGVLVAAIGLGPGAARASGLEVVWQLFADTASLTFEQTPGAKVHTVAVRGVADLPDGSSLSARLEADVISAASRILAPVDAMSTATPHPGREFRGGWGGGWERRFGATTVVMGGGGSLEPDYRAGNVEVGLRRDLAQRTTVLAASYGFAGARILPRGRAPHPALEAESFGHSLRLSWDQVLGRRLRGRAVEDLRFEHGFLSNPYAMLPTPTGAAREVLPGRRFRSATTVELASRLGPTTGLWTGVRVYGDEWGIFAPEARIRLAQQVAPTFTMRVRYRLYVQRGSPWFSRRRPDEGEPWFTPDQRYGPMISHLWGVEGILRDLLDRVSVRVGYRFYLSDTGLQAHVLSVSLGLKAP